MTGDLAYLGAKGNLSPLNSEVQGAILQLFREQDKRIPAPTPTISQPRPAVSIETYVTSVERLAKAIRG
jgi:hypothetical protein